MVYLLNDRRLATDLRLGAVSEAHKLTYLLIYVLSPILSELPGQRHSRSGFMLEYGFLIGLAGTIIWGMLTYHFYKVNKQGDGLHFIERYICLSIPFTIRLIAVACIISIPVFVIIALIGKIIGSVSGDTPLPVVAIGIFVLALFTFYTYRRMSLLFSIASGQRE